MKATKREKEKIEANKKSEPSKTQEEENFSSLAGGNPIEIENVSLNNSLKESPSKGIQGSLPIEQNIKTGQSEQSDQKLLLEKVEEER